MDEWGLIVCGVASIVGWSLAKPEDQPRLPRTRALWRRLTKRSTS